MTGDTLPRLLAALRDPRAYPHPVHEVEVIETHISYVLLAGDHAYKLKKPLDLRFLDYGTLARRHEMCREELRRNRLLAPGLYEGVVAITGSPDAPCLRNDPPPDGETPLEYAVRMRRFPQEAQLDRRLAAGRLDVADMARIAECVARYQAAAPRAAPDGVHGRPADVWRPVDENFAQILPRLDDPALRARVEALREWSGREHGRIAGVVTERLRGGFVRACHGDLHLTNLAEIDGRIVAFDGIEFDPNLYWVDVVSDTAFLVMDLLARGRRDLAATFLDAWLQETGDFDGLRLLRPYLVYRSLVRAKVAAIAMSQHPGDASVRLRERLLRHLELAERIAGGGRGAVLVLCGLAGSGKSTLARLLVRELAALSVHSDVERRRLFGMGATEPSHSPLDGGIYTQDAHRRTYARVDEAVRAIVASGHVAVADACFLRRAERERLRSVAAGLGVPAHVVHLDVPEDELLRRVRVRQEAGGDASEAGPEVVLRQVESFEPPGADEPHVCVTAEETQLAETAQRIARALGHGRNA